MNESSIVNYIEPFFDSNLNLVRGKLLRATFEETYYTDIMSTLTDKTPQECTEELCRLIAKLQFQIDQLSTAITPEAKYVDPPFVVPLPEISEVIAHQIDIDFRKKVIGANWSPPEAFGRRSGLGLVSSVTFRALEPGQYTMHVTIPASFKPQNVNLLHITLGSKTLDISQITSTAEAHVCSAQFEIDAPSALPFHCLKINLAQLQTVPSDSGQNDGPPSLPVSRLVITPSKPIS